MLRKYRQLIIGLCIGTLLFGVLPAFADEILTNLRIMQNPYPVIVDGKQEEVQAYNIDGYTFLKLADVGKLLGSTVKFNETDNRIEITKNIGGEAVKKESTSISGDTKVKSRFVIVKKDDSEYVLVGDIANKFYSKYKDDKNGLDYKDKKLVLIKSGETIIESIPYVTIDENHYIEYTYFEQNILPLLKESE